MGKQKVPRGNNVDVTAAGNFGKKTSQRLPRTRHIALACPSASIIHDALARSFAAAIYWPVAATRTSYSLLREVGGAMITGFRGVQGGGMEGEAPFRVMTSELAKELMIRRNKNADRGEKKECPPDTSPT